MVYIKVLLVFLIFRQSVLGLILALWSVWLLRSENKSPAGPRGKS